jgi:cyclophilin family peptidyl-prolyl cis-trans isomerase
MGKRERLRKEKIEQMKKERKEYFESKYHQKNPWARFWLRFDFWIYFVAFVLIVAYPLIPSKFLGNFSEVQAETSGAILHTSMGDITIQFFPKDAPNTVANFQKLTNQGFYSNLLWHRVIKGFVIQTGDPNGDGTGGPGYKFNDEINSHKIVAGTVAMANSGANTNGSQFFIDTDSPQTSLDGHYTVFGQVTSGMDVVHLINQAPTDSSDKPLSPVYLKSVELIN